MTVSVPDAAQALLDAWDAHAAANTRFRDAIETGSPTENAQVSMQATRRARATAVDALRAALAAARSEDEAIECPTCEDTGFLWDTGEPCPACKARGEAAVTPPAPADDDPMGRYRTGRKVAQNVYDGDRPIFQAHSAEEAARLVRLLNLGLYAETTIADPARPSSLCPVCRNWPGNCDPQVDHSKEAK